MKKISAFLMVIFVAVAGFSQQSTSFTNLQMNPYTINPAFAGTSEKTPIRLMVKNQFVGLSDNNPNTQLISGHFNYDGYGIGALLFNDTYGSFRQTGFKFTYSYIMKISEDMSMSFALSPSGMQMSVDQSNYVFFDDNDEAISNAKENAFVFDADFGALLRGENFYAGFSAMNLIQPKITLGSNDSEDNKIMRSYNFIGAYNYVFSDEFSLEPFLLFGYSDPLLKYQIDLHAHIMKHTWAGAGYSSAGLLNIKLGGSYQNYHLGYAYGLSLGKLSDYSGGTHEIVLGIDLNAESLKSKPKL
jgi:type IX secretion system PorP/SprF family membrane protein